MQLNNLGQTFPNLWYVVCIQMKSCTFATAEIIPDENIYTYCSLGKIRGWKYS